MIITKAKILSGGSGFRVGDLLTVKSEESNSTDTILKVKSVDANGAIKSLVVVKFGYGHSILSSKLFIAGQEYTVTLPQTFEDIVIDPDTDITSGEIISPSSPDSIYHENHGFETGDKIIYTVVNGTPIYGLTNYGSYRAIKIDDDNFAVGRYTDNVAINIFWVGVASTTIPCSYEYTTVDVNDDPLVTVHHFYKANDTDIMTFTTGDLSIEFEFGNLCQYPGYYLNGNNIIGDEIYIQDSFYYQAFSYVTALAKTIDEYGAILRDVIHPSGSKHFARYEIGNDFTVNVTLDTSTDLLERPDSFYDVTNTTDSITSLEVDKYTDETVTLSQSGNVYCEPFYVETPYLTPYWEVGYLEKEQSFIS